MSQLEWVPLELLTLIFTSLRPADLLECGCVCRAMRRVAESEQVWRRMAIITLHPILDAFFNGTMPPPPRLTRRVDGTPRASASSRRESSPKATAGTLAVVSAEGGEEEEEEGWVLSACSRVMLRPWECSSLGSA